MDAFFFSGANSRRWEKDLLLFSPFNLTCRILFNDRFQWGKGTWGNNQGRLHYTVTKSLEMLFCLGQQTDCNRCKSFFFFKVIFEQTSYTLRYTLITILKTKQNKNKRKKTSEKPNQNNNNNKTTKNPSKPSGLFPNSIRILISR